MLTGHAIFELCYNQINQLKTGQSSIAPSYWLSWCATSWESLNTVAVLSCAWCTASLPRAQRTAILPSAPSQNIF